MDQCALTRARVGASALRVLNNHGIEIAGQMFQGGFAALIVCLNTIYGANFTRDLFRQIMGEIPGDQFKPRIVIDNDKIENIVA